MNQNKKTTLACIKAKLGNAEDDHNRASRAFDGLDLEEEHGQSGKSRAKILAEYAQAMGQYRDALNWVKSL